MDGDDGGRQGRHRRALYHPRGLRLGETGARHQPRRRLHPRGRPPSALRRHAEGVLAQPLEDRRRGRAHLRPADRRHFDYNAINDFELLPEHIEAAAFAEPDAYPTRTRYATDPTNPGLYNGPYRVAEVAPGSHIVLIRNAYWKGPAPAFERIVVRAIENTAALEANLLSGAIDLIAGEIGLTLDQAEAMKARHGERYQVIFKPSLAYEHIDLNLDNPDLADVRVRRALLLALDREAISRQLFAGRQPVADSNVSPLDRMAAADVAGHTIRARRRRCSPRLAGAGCKAACASMPAAGRCASS
ncbi:MAG: ABC transporter substrate-binding protein [Rhodospirillales bacterium]